MQSIIISGSGKGDRLNKFEELSKQTIGKLKNNLDFILVDETPTIGIESIRNLEKYLFLKPSSGRKIVLISEAQNLTVEAQNSLLKTLEEPPGYCEIYLCCSDKGLLLPTIVSRCLVYRLPAKENNLPEEEVKKYRSDFFNLLKSGFGKRLLYLDEFQINKSKESALLWLNQITHILRNELIGKNDTSKNVILEVLKQTNTTIIYLNLNTNVKLALDNFVLSLPLTP